MKKKKIMRSLLVVLSVFVATGVVGQNVQVELQKMSDSTYCVDRMLIIDHADETIQVLRTLVVTSEVYTILSCAEMHQLYTTDSLVVTGTASYYQPVQFWKMVNYPFRTIYYWDSGSKEVTRSPVLWGEATTGSYVSWYVYIIIAIVIFIIFWLISSFYWGNNNTNEFNTPKWSRWRWVGGITLLLLPIFMPLPLSLPTFLSNFLIFLIFCMFVIGVATLIMELVELLIKRSGF